MIIRNACICTHSVGKYSYTYSYLCIALLFNYVYITKFICLKFHAGDFIL